MLLPCTSHGGSAKYIACFSCLSNGQNFAKLCAHFCLITCAEIKAEGVPVKCQLVLSFLLSHFFIFCLKHSEYKEVEVRVALM